MRKVRLALFRAYVEADGKLNKEQILEIITALEPFVKDFIPEPVTEQPSEAVNG